MNQLFFKGVANSNEFQMSLILRSLAESWLVFFFLVNIHLAFHCSTNREKGKCVFCVWYTMFKLILWRVYHIVLKVTQFTIVHNMQRFFSFDNHLWHHSMQQIKENTIKLGICAKFQLVVMIFFHSSARMLFFSFFQICNNDY